MTYWGEKWLKKRSLAFKLSAGVLLCVFLAKAALLGIVTKRSEAVIEQQIVELADNAVQTSINNISHLVQETEQNVRGMRNMLSELREDTHFIEIVLGAAIKSVYASGLGLSHATVYSFSSPDRVSGKMYSTFVKDGEDVFRKTKVDNFYEMFSWWKDFPDSDSVFWSEPYVSPNSGGKQMVVTCVMPFKFQGEKEFSGFVSISINLQDIQRYINDSPFYGAGKLLLVSRSGLYITHPDPDINLKMTIFELAKKQERMELFDIGRRVLTGRSGKMTMPYSSVFREPTIFFYAPVPLIGWGVCLVYAKNQLFEPVYQLQIIIVISAFASMLILWLMVNAICRYSTRPLQRLGQIAAQYGKGDFTDDMSEIRSSDEIGALSAAFHNMSRDLRNYVEKERKDASRKQKALSEMLIAQQIQQSSLPVDFPHHEAFRIYATMTAVRQVGGDFYDFFFLDGNKFAFVIADVSGKGVSAALYMMRVREIIKQMANYVKSVSEIFEHTNNILCEGNKACMFVSAFLAVVHLDSGEMEYVNAGHTPPFLVYNGQPQKIVPASNLVLGARNGVSYSAEKIKLQTGQSVFLYTDGVTEAENSDGVFYGEERLFRVLQKNVSNPESMVKNVMCDVENFACDAKQTDDITMLSFLYCGSAEDVLTVKADIKKIGFVLDFIEQCMEKKGISKKISSKMIVIAEEIFSNIAQYAYAESGKVEIRIVIEKDCCFLVFADSGKPYNPLEQEAPDISQPLKDRAFGGLGVFIVKQMADCIEYAYENGKNFLKTGLFMNDR